MYFKSYKFGYNSIYKIFILIICFKLMIIHILLHDLAIFILFSK